MLTKKTVSILLLAVSWLPIFCNQSDSLKITANPLYVNSQFAGNLGLVSVGIGKSYFNNKLTVGFKYGYLPKFINGNKVHILALKTALHFREYSTLGIRYGLYMGTSVNFSIASNTYLKYPDYYPEGYYMTNAIHLNPFMGVRFILPHDNGKFDNISVYTELGTVDYKIWYALKNKKISADEIWNLCFGIAFQLKQ